MVESQCDFHVEGGLAVVLLGHKHDGRIVTDTAVPLPEGASVRIEFFQDELDTLGASGNPQVWTQQLDDRRSFLIDREIAGAFCPITNSSS